MPPINWQNSDVMEEKTLIFEPDAKAYFKKSVLYAVSTFGRAITIAARYLASTINNPMNVAITDHYIDLFWRAHFQSTFTNLYATGRNLLNPEESYVFMSNHESWMDIPAMFGAVPNSLRMVSKMGLMKVPILGQAMINGGFIFVDRKNRSRAIRQLEEAKHRMGPGISIWIAPEGTRTRSGIIGPFKKGGFYLAKGLNKAIVPVFIEGARLVMPADSLLITPNKSITVHFCAPVTKEEVAHLGSNVLANMVRERILDKQKECSNAYKNEGNQ